MKKMILVCTFIALLLLLPYHNTEAAYARKENVVKKVNDLKVTIRHHAAYRLPTTVPAIMSDNSKKLVVIKWSAKIVNTEKLVYLSTTAM